MEENKKKIKLILNIIILVLISLSPGIDLYAQTAESRNVPLPTRPPVPAPAFSSKPNALPKKTSKTKKTDTSKVVDSQGPRTSTTVNVMGKSMHLSCNKSIRNLKTNKVECFGNVYIRRPSELMTSDYALLDLNTEDLHAEGNVVYFTGDTVIYGVKMDFNFTTETGVITDGRVENDRYELLGEEIQRLSEEEFKVRDGEYTTCRDCPPSWRLAAKTVDFRVEGYASLGNIYIKVNDAPTLYIPYAIIPVKTKRQSGLLFPKMGTSQLNGFMFVQPFYWAISRSTDATVGLGFYMNRGRKAEGEFRYVLGEKTSGKFNGYYIRDKQFNDDNKHRSAFEYSHNVKLPWNIEQKAYWLQSTDRDYARNFNDIPGNGEPALVSDIGLSRAGRDASIWINYKRIQNNLTPVLVGFDRSTVQLQPSISLATVDHRISEDIPLHWGVTSNFSRFWRKGSIFDALPENGVVPDESVFIKGKTPIRRANRFMVVPELYYTARAWDILEIVPSVQYRGYYYTLNTELDSSLTRGYLVAQNEFATTFENVYGESIKHKIKPSFTYSAIPVVNQNPSDHSLIKQFKTAGNQFDETDIVPITNETMLYNVPLGNSLTVQVSNKIISKDAEDPKRPSYVKKVEMLTGESINFIEYRKPKGSRQPLSRLFNILDVNTLRVQSNMTYYYYPYLKASTYSFNSNYIFSQYTRRLLEFKRSFGIGYNYNQVESHSNSISGNITWSVNDYFQLLGGVGHQFTMYLNSGVITDYTMSVNAGFTYQSPSQCYRFTLLGSYVKDRKWEFTFNLPINLSGSTFTSFTDSSSYSAVGGSR